MRNLALLLPLAVLACAAKDDDEGGEGGPVDTDGDGLSDDDEVGLGTDPSNPDTDGDGLEDGAEIDEGSDPFVTDSDGDGFQDGEEVDGGADPTNAFSWPTGSGQWPDNSAQAEADGVDGDTFGRNEVLPDFSATDQFGNPVSLYQFYGYIVLIDYSAGWCDPCNDAAQEADVLWGEFRSDGFIIIHAMLDDWNGGPADLEFRQEWAEQYRLEFPILGDDDGDDITAMLEGMYKAGLYNQSIPFLVLLDRDMNLEMSYTGAGNEDAIRSRVERMLDD